MQRLQMFLIISTFVRTINLETDALITAAAMSLFGMESLDDKAESFIPPDILKASREKRREECGSTVT